MSGSKAELAESQTRPPTVGEIRDAMAYDTSKAIAVIPAYRHVAVLQIAYAWAIDNLRILSEENLKQDDKHHLVEMLHVTRHAVDAGIITKLDRYNKERIVKLLRQRAIT